MFWQRLRGVKLSNALSPPKCIWCSNTLSGRWRILRGVCVTKWKIGLSGFTKPGWGWGSAFALYRTPCAREGGFSQCASWCDCKCGSDEQKKQAQIRVRKKGWCNWDQTKKAARYRTIRSDAIFLREQGYDTDVVGTVIQQRQGSDWRGKADSTENECHRQKELTCGDEMWMMFAHIYLAIRVS